MNLIQVTLTETIHSPDTQRDRVIDDWSILSRPANNPSITINYLIGNVVEEGGRPIKGRFTKTSPITSEEDGVVVTASGSTYTLGMMSSAFGDQLSLEELEAAKIPERFHNPWLVGDNWKTI